MGDNNNTVRACRSNLSILILAFVASLCVVGEARAQVGEITQSRGDEEIQARGTNTWERVSTGRQLQRGDRLRTGNYGALALKLRDASLMRLQRNSLLELKQVRDNSVRTTVVRLEQGSVWSRARTFFRKVAGQLLAPENSLNMDLPSISVGIRGTDWFASADEDGTSTLIMLSGRAEVSNEFGAIELLQGEVARVPLGQPPTKRVLVDLQDRPLLLLDMDVIWLDLFSVSGLRAGGFDSEAATVGIEAQLARLEAAFDLYRNDIAAASIEALERSGDLSRQQAGRLKLVQALLQLRNRAFEQADFFLTDAEALTSGRYRMLAAMARAGFMIEFQQYAQAETVVTRTQSEFAEDIEPLLMRAWLASFAGQRELAIDVAAAAAQRFPGNARAPALLAYLHLLQGDGGRTGQFIDAALLVDSGLPLALHARGVYHTYVEPDAQAALAAFDQATTVAPYYGASWNGKAIVYAGLGDFDNAEEAIVEAGRTMPNVSTIKANHGYLLATVDRLDEAQLKFDEAIALRPDDSYALLASGVVELKRGNEPEAIEAILSALTINPKFPFADVLLASAYYQDDRYAAAREALSDARRNDPDDPGVDIIGSILAVDRFQADEAVTLARQGFEKAKRTRSFAVDNIANSRSGSATLGNAYTNLGLNDAGGYHTLQSFNPYLPGGYFICRRPISLPPIARVLQPTARD